MIIDRMDYITEYESMLPHLASGLAFLQENPRLSEGKHVFPGGFVLVQAGMTRPVAEGTFEAHKKYIDIQILVEGNEIVVWNRLEKMTQIGDYDEEKDKLTLGGEGAVLELKPGMFCALFSSDAHTACRHLEGAQANPYKKYVMKLEYK